MEMTGEASPSRDLKHGRVTVGLEPQPLFFTTKLARGVALRASEDNTAPVYIGGPNVSPEDGMPIVPSGAITLPLDDPSGIYLVSTDTDQIVNWIGM